MMLGVIKRTFRYMDIDMFLTLYKSLIIPHLEGNSCIWNPYFQKHIKSIEQVQRRATKLVEQLR